jgi:hypothetical protein
VGTIDFLESLVRKMHGAEWEQNKFQVPSSTIYHITKKTIEELQGMHANN